MGKIKTAICTNCDFKEDYEPDEDFGLTWQQADGTCPNCGSDLVDEEGKPTKETFTITLTPKS